MTRRHTDSANSRVWHVVILLVLFAGVGRGEPLAADEPTLSLHASFPSAVREQRYSGRVYLFFSRNSFREPRFGPNWFGPDPFVSTDVKNWPPEQPLEFRFDENGVLAFGNSLPKAGQRVRTFPKNLSANKLAGLRVQAVFRFSDTARRVGTGHGNAYSSVQTIPSIKDLGQRTDDFTLQLSADKIVKQREFPENRWTKLLRVRSARLSKHHGRDTFLQAAVVLPASWYDQPQRRYPTLFVIPGFGGNHFSGVAREPVPADETGVEVLRVVLDPECYWGHHVFADSATNGPVGAALVKEFLPEFDRQFRSIPKSTARFVTGHSSGGWSSLWLQVTYPDTFGGVWSTAPDPVDFGDFQQIDLYRDGENMYVNADGERRPLARVRGQVRVWYEDFDQMEVVLGPGGQLRSFEAVFSPRSPDGTPARAWNRDTGVVDVRVTERWKPYDIRLKLEKNWETLGPKLAGKIHVHMGTEDTFYLEGATRRLKESLAKLKSDAVVEMHDGKDHSSLMTRELRNRIRREMIAQFLKHHPAERRSQE